jgi:hypothetical protein
MAKQSSLSKWLWFAGLWLAGVATLLFVAFAIRLMI